MKIAIISLTKKGYNLSLQLKSILDKNPKILSTKLFYKNVKNTIKFLVYEYDAIICIMATGIVIRSVAPFLNSKTKDPAILTIDEEGKFVISLLSGHIGGANSLTRYIANIINAQPVITTATDVNNKLGIDVLSKDLFLKILNPHEIVHFNKAILNNKIVTLETNEENMKFLNNYVKSNTLEIHLSLKVNNKLSDNKIIGKYENHKLEMEIRDLVVGIGCRRGKSLEDIEKGLNFVLNDLNITKYRISYIASAEIKKNEEGLLELGNKLNKEIKFVDLDQLKLFRNSDIEKSDFVKSKFGIYGVCEPSALIVAGFDSELIYKKTAFNGVTIAIAVSK